MNSNKCWSKIERFIWILQEVHLPTIIISVAGGLQTSEGREEQTTPLISPHWRMQFSNMAVRISFLLNLIISTGNYCNILVIISLQSLSVVNVIRSRLDGFSLVHFKCRHSGSKTKTKLIMLHDWSWCWQCNTFKVKRLQVGLTLGWSSGVFSFC